MDPKDLYIACVKAGVFGGVQRRHKMDQLTGFPKDLYLACVKARARFAEQNGQVSQKVWDDNYEAVRVLDEAIKAATDQMNIRLTS